MANTVEIVAPLSLNTHRKENACGISLSDGVIINLQQYIIFQVFIKS